MNSERKAYKTLSMAHFGIALKLCFKEGEIATDQRKINN